MTFVLVLIMNIGTVERHGLSADACNRAVMSAPLEVAKYPDGMLVRVECRKETS